MRILIALILLLNGLISFSQHKVTLIIDTIDFVDDYDEYNFNVFLTNQGFANLGETDSTAVISTDIFPNFYTTLFLKTESTLIRIPIDQRNGYLELSNVFENDTIRINYLKLYSNCYEDSINTRIEYYRVKRGNTADLPYKVKFKASTEVSNCKRKPPSETVLTINGKRHLAKIVKRKSEAIDIIKGHGYKPRQTERNHEYYSGTKLYSSSMTVRHINVMAVRIK